jgi:hypothetical protein
VSVIDLYQLIVSLGFFNVSNRHTFGAIFRDKEDRPDIHRFAADVVLRYLAT